MNLIIKHSYRFFLLLALQAFLLSQITVFRYGESFIYIFFILFMPLQWPKWLQYILAFSSGLVLDLLTGTYGLHAISATVIIAIRQWILLWILPSYNEEEWSKVNLFDRRMGEFVPYALSLSFVYSLVFFSADFFTFKFMPRWLYHVVLSTLFTFVSLFIYRYIFATADKVKEV